MIQKKLQAIDLTGKIQTSFVERMNLTLRELTAPLARKTWSMAFDETHLLLHVEWVRAYYHFARPHMSLKGSWPMVELAIKHQRLPPVLPIVDGK